jgi:hypothetical protein
MPRKAKLDASWRQPLMRKCEAPKEVGKAPRCGKPFPAIGVKKTCSPECSHRLFLMWRKKNYRKNAAKIIAAQRDRWLAKPRECAVCKKIFQPIKNSKACLKCREEFRKSQAQQYYLNNPEKWERSYAKRTVFLDGNRLLNAQCRGRRSDRNHIRLVCVSLLAPWPPRPPQPPVPYEVTIAAK